MESVVLADPDFDLAETSSPIMAAVPSMGQSGVSVKRTRLPVYFSRLLGTREEGEQIATLLGVSPWLSTGALEGRLKPIALCLAYRHPRLFLARPRVG